MSQRWQPAPYRAPGGTHFLHDRATDRLLISGPGGSEILLPVADLVAFLDRRGDPRAAQAERDRPSDTRTAATRPPRFPH